MSTMIDEVEQVPIAPRSPARFAELLGQASVDALETRAGELREQLGDRVVWNVNSTAAGGGVAEMLHSLLAYARGLEIDTRWAVVKGNARFFGITKRIHNALHGENGDGSALGKAEREVYEGVCAENSRGLCDLIRPGDIVILHDPQTAGTIPALVAHGARVIWRCHIGADQPSAEGDRAWRFLEPDLRQAHAFVFSRFAYLPEFFDHGRSVILAPSIDPFSPKNQELDAGTVAAILARCGLLSGPAPEAGAEFVRGDGTRAEVTRSAVLHGGQAPPDPAVPLLLQVSRWDRLKDPVGVLEGFARLVGQGGADNAELMLAGPDVTAVADDPEGKEVFEEVAARWEALPVKLRRRVHLANLPMDDLEENAAMVNAIQRHAAVVIQKSLREGFGLTVTEAMWKGRAVVASAVGGIQDQIEHGVSGMLLRDPCDIDAFAEVLRQLVERPALGPGLGRAARRRVTQHYLGLRSLEQYAELLDRVR